MSKTGNSCSKIIKQWIGEVKMFSYNSDLQNNLRAMQEKQHEDKQWKEDVLSVLSAIDEKLGKLLEGK